MYYKDKSIRPDTPGIITPSLHAATRADKEWHGLKR